MFDGFMRPVSSKDQTHIRSTLSGIIGRLRSLEDRIEEIFDMYNTTLQLVRILYHTQSTSRTLE